MYPQLRLHDVELVAVCDLIEEKAQAAAERYGFGAVYTDFRRMLDEQRPDAVICIGGPKVHYEVGIPVMQAGFSVYVQKSPAPSSEKAREMASVARDKGVVCHVGFNIRSSQAVQFAKGVVAREEFGPTALVVVRYGLTSGQRVWDVVSDQHCHAWDLARYLGGEITEVSVRRGEVEGDRGYVGWVKYASGAVGTLNFTSGQIPSKEFVYFEVTGTNGHFVTGHDFDAAYRRVEGPDEVLRTGNYGGALRELTWLGYVDDLASYLGAVRGEARDVCPVEDTVATMELCEEAYRQLREQGSPE
jgi:predicted dehydrogenase